MQTTNNWCKILFISAPCYTQQVLQLTIVDCQTINLDTLKAITTIAVMLQNPKTANKPEQWQHFEELIHGAVSS